MLPPLKLDQAINRLVREEWGRILASLVSQLGHLQLAEDALQDAVEVACVDWNNNGLPQSPSAWLLTTARRKAIDQIRRQKRMEKLQPELHYLNEMDSYDTTDNPAELLDVVIPDKRLELIFTCCHPALDNKTRVALTLRTLGGLTTEEIARAFMDKPATMAQRLVRARRKITTAGIAYEVPSADRLVERLEGVLSVIYFIFNEGYTASTGQRITRTSLTAEAIRLGRIVYALMPEHSEVAGLLSLMLLHDSRRSARQDDDGKLVLLENQSRNRWDQHQIAEGTGLLKETLARGQPGPYQLQAAISAVHAEAPDWTSTDWPQVIALYEVLYSLQPSPVVRLNQAVAISYGQSPETAIQIMHELAEKSVMQSYHPFHAAFADVSFRAGDTKAAIKSMCSAITLSHSDAERDFLKRRLADMQALNDVPVGAGKRMPDLGTL